MSYQVIARKWRPQTFAEIVEQQHVTRTLQNAIHEEAIKHTEGAGRDVFGAAATRPLIIGHGRRRILHFNVTSHPTAGWIMPQLREAFPPRFLIFDRDAKYGFEVPLAVRLMAVHPVRTSHQSPWQNGVAGCELSAGSTGSGHSPRGSWSCDGTAKTRRPAPPLRSGCLNSRAVVKTSLRRRVLAYDRAGGSPT